jgi:hypothetical protein
MAWGSGLAALRERKNMEIQSLKLLITDADFAILTAKMAEDQEGIEDLKTRVTPEGVILEGRYGVGFGFKMPFETLWQPSVAGSIIQVRLANIKVAGLPAGMFRKSLLSQVRATAEEHKGVSVQEDVVVIDVPAIAKAEGIDLQVKFVEVRLSIGSAVIEAG